jgi:xanthine dehydrogenase accessory factor
VYDARVNEDERILREAAELAARGEAFALVTVVRTAGSTPRKAGAKMIVHRGGSTVGTVGGGRVEAELRDEALASLADGKARLVKRHLTRDLAMCCGGEMEAFVEPMGRKEHLVLVGGGHISAALAPIGHALGFAVTVVDDLPELASDERFPTAEKRHDFSPRTWGVPLADTTFIVVATRDHAVDQTVLEQLANLGAAPAYLGVIGSKAKLVKFRARLEARNVAADWIARIRGPIGVDVGAETPAEIAVAVAAELVHVRRRGA